MDKFDELFDYLQSFYEEDNGCTISDVVSTAISLASDAQKACKSEIDDLRTALMDLGTEVTAHEGDRLVTPSHAGLRNSINRAKNLLEGKEPKVDG